MECINTCNFHAYTPRWYYMLYNTCILFTGCFFLVHQSKPIIELVNVKAAAIAYKSCYKTLDIKLASYLGQMKG